MGEVIRQELSAMLSDGTVKDPRIAAAMATVTTVDVSPDLQHAKAYVSIFTEDPEVRETVLQGLASAAGVLRKELGDRLGMRHTPELRFGYDSSIEYGARIEAVLAEIKHDEGDG